MRSTTGWWRWARSCPISSISRSSGCCSQTQTIGGHHIGHSLFVGLVLLLPGLYLITRRGKAGLALVGAAHVSHILSDSVTHVPRSLLWPLLGTDFAQVTLLGTRATILTETAAGLILLLVARWVTLRGRLDRLLLEGRL